MQLKSLALALPALVSMASAQNGAVDSALSVATAAVASAGVVATSFIGGGEHYRVEAGCAALTNPACDTVGSTVTSGGNSLLSSE